MSVSPVAGAVFYFAIKQAVIRRQNIMYLVGDLIIYGNSGVCRIEKITRDEASDKTRTFYTLKPLYQNCMITTPADNTRIPMRAVISKDEADRLIDQIPTIQVEAFHSSGLRQLSEHYDNLLKTYECQALIELILSIYTKKQAAEEQKRKIGAVDEQFLKRAEELLYGELAAALELPKQEVPMHIASRVGSISSLPLRN